MQETRRARIGAVIQEELAVLVSRELKDPRVPPVTFTAVEVAQDASTATVFVAILGGAAMGPGGEELSEAQAKDRMKKCIDGLTSAAGFFRRHLARVLSIRHIPTLSFREDRGFENAHRVYELLKQIEPSKP